MPAKLALTRTTGVAAALTLLVGGCGSSSRKPAPSTPAAFRAQLGALCAQERNALTAAPASQHNQIAARYLAKTKALVPPASLKAPFDQFVATVEQLSTAAQTHLPTVKVLKLVHLEQELLTELGFTRPCGEPQSS